MIFAHLFDLDCINTRIDFAKSWTVEITPAISTALASI